MKSIGERLILWRSLFDGLAAHPEDAAALAEEHAELGRYLEEIEDQMYQAGKHEAGLREANRRRLELEEKTAELHGRIALLLRGRHGKRNPLLHGYGLEPHGVRGPNKQKPAKKADKAAEPPAG
jgi:hypothetical protein